MTNHRNHAHVATPAARAECRRNAYRAELDAPVTPVDTEDMPELAAEILRTGVSPLNGYVAGYGSQDGLRALNWLIDNEFVWETKIGGMADGDVFCDTKGYEWRRLHGIDR